MKEIEPLLQSREKSGQSPAIAELADPRIPRDRLVHRERFIRSPGGIDLRLQFAVGANIPVRLQ